MFQIKQASLASQIKQEARAIAVDGKVPRGTGALLARKYKTRPKYVSRLLEEARITIGEGSVYPQYEPPMEDLVDRGDCLELEHDTAARYDIVCKYNRYRRRNHIKTSGQTAFDKEFEKFLKLYKLEDDWNAID